MTGEKDMGESQEIRSPLAPPRTAGGSQGGSHMSTVRSLGLMHDLQEYIVTVEAIAAKRKTEIERLKGEKREMEKLLAMRKGQDRQSSGRNDSPTKFGPKSGFGDISNQDMPPKIRGIVEDNRMLKEEIKMFREKSRALERTIAGQQLQLNKMKEENEALQAKLKDCSRTPEQVQSEAELTEQLTQRGKAVSELENKLSVLQHKMSTDAKLAKDALKAKDKEIAALKAKLTEKQSDIESKDKEVRQKVLDNRATQKKLDASRTKAAEARRECYRLQDEVQELHKSTFGGTFKDEYEQRSSASKVHVMLLFIDSRGPAADDGNGDADEAADAKPELGEDEAAVLLQATYRGHLVRKEMASAKSEEEQSAAIKIQAQARGHLARKEVEAVRAGEGLQDSAAEEEAAVKIQAGIRGHIARKEVAAKRLEAKVVTGQQEGAPEDAVPAKSSGKGPKSDSGSPAKKGQRAAKPTNAANSSKAKK